MIGFLLLTIYILGGIATLAYAIPQLARASNGAVEFAIIAALAMLAVPFWLIFMPFYLGYKYFE